MHLIMTDFKWEADALVRAKKLYAQGHDMTVNSLEGACVYMRVCLFVCTCVFVCFYGGGGWLVVRCGIYQPALYVSIDRHTNHVFTHPPTYSPPLVVSIDPPPHPPHAHIP